MTATTNFYENPLAGNAGGVGLGAGVGGLIGAALGNGSGLFGGGNRETATLDQVDSRFNALQDQLQSNQVLTAVGDVNQSIGGSTAALALGLAGVKDAVVAAASQNALSLCGLGHSMQAGFASVNSTVISEAARGRELALQTENARLLAANAALHSDAKHTQTQFMIQNIASAK